MVVNLPNPPSVLDWIKNQGGESRVLEPEMRTIIICLRDDTQDGVKHYMEN